MTLEGGMDLFAITSRTDTLPLGWLTVHAVREMRHAGRVDDTAELQRHVRDREVLEEARPRAEQDGDEMELELVEQSRRQRLLADARAAGDLDVLPPGDRESLLDGGFDAVGHEGERRSSLLRHGVAPVARHDEHGHAEGRIVA